MAFASWAVMSRRALLFFLEYFVFCPLCDASSLSRFYAAQVLVVGLRGTGAEVRPITIFESVPSSSRRFSSLAVFLGETPKPEEGLRRHSWNPQARRAATVHRATMDSSFGCGDGLCCAQRRSLVLTPEPCVRTCLCGDSPPPTRLRLRLRIIGRFRRTFC